MATNTKKQETSIITKFNGKFMPLHKKAVKLKAELAAVTKELTAAESEIIQEFRDSGLTSLDLTGGSKLTWKEKLTSSVDVEKLFAEVNKNVKLFLTIVSATKKAVTEKLGTGALDRCTVETVGDKQPSLEVGKS